MLHVALRGTMHDLLGADLPCKVVIAIREEYLAHLSNFERSVPRLFDKRLRVEPMTRTNARRVILETAKNPKFKKVYDSWKAFRDDQILWFRVAEQNFDGFMATANTVSRGAAPAKAPPAKK